MRFHRPSMPTEVRRWRDRAPEIEPERRKARLDRALVFSAVVQAVFAIVLTVVTAWNAALTRDLLHAQIEPELEVHFEVEGTELVLENVGPVDIVDLRVDTEDHVFINAKRRTVGRHGRKNPTCHFGTLEPGRTQRCSLAEEADSAMRSASTYAPAFAAQIRNLDPIVVARVSYRRKVDGKAFKITRAFLALCCGSTGSATLHEGLGVPREVDDSIRDLAFGSLAEPRRLEP